MTQKTLFAFLLGIVGLGMVSAAGARLRSGEDDGALMEEVLLTATKREESIYDGRISISAPTGQTIEMQGITNLIDIGKTCPT